MVQSYKIKSYIATAIGGIATCISILGVDQLQTIFPQFGKYIPVLFALATWYLSQTTENKRVDVAEKLAVIKHEAELTSTIDPAAEYNTVNTNDAAGEEDGT